MGSTNLPFFMKKNQQMQLRIVYVGYLSRLPVSFWILWL